MIIHEVVLEGIRLFRGNKRLSFTPGLTLIHGPNESGKTTIFNTLLALLYPDAEADESGLTPWGTSGEGPSRMGLLVSEDKVKYRLLHDCVHNQWSLATMNLETKKFEPTATDAEEIRSVLSSSCGLPQRQVYEAICTLTAARMPSRQSGIVTVAAPQPVAGAPGQMQPGMPGGMDLGMGDMTGGGQYDMSGSGYGMAPADPYAGMSKAEKEKRIEELKAEIEGATELEDLQFKQDGLEAKLFEAKNKLKAITELDESLKQATGVLDENKGLDDMPDDILQRIARYDTLKKTQRQEEEALELEYEQLDAQHRVLANRSPFYQTPIFIGAAAAFVVSIVLFIALPREPSYLQFIPLVLMIGGVLAGAYTGWMEFTHTEKETTAKRELAEFEDKRRNALKKFEVEAAVIKRLMAEAKVDSPSVLEEKINKYKNLKKRHERLLAKREETIREIDYDALISEQERLQHEIEQVEENIGRFSGFSGDPVELKREMERLEESLNNPQPSPAPGMAAPSSGAGMAAMPNGAGGQPGMPGAMPAATVPPGTAAPVVTVASQASPLKPLLEAGERLLALDSRSVLMGVKNRFGVYFSAFTEKKYLDGEFTDDGDLSLRTMAGHYADFTQVSPATQDAAYTAVILVLIEQALKRVRVPLLFDDPFRSFDDVRLSMVCRALKKLAQQTQVFLFSTHAGPGKIADATVSLSTSAGAEPSA